MKSLAGLKHDSTNLLAALDLARAYGSELYTGVFYRNPNPPPTYDALVKLRQAEDRPSAPYRGSGSSTCTCRSEGSTMGANGIDFKKLTLVDALDLAVLIEEEARDRYVELADQLTLHHTPEAAAFFTRWSRIEEQHRKQLQARRAQAVRRTAAPPSPAQMLFDVEAPDYDEARAFMTRARRRSPRRCGPRRRPTHFFIEALRSVNDAEVVALFDELREEEVHHQNMVRAEIAKLPPDADPESGRTRPTSRRPSNSYCKDPFGVRRVSDSMGALLALLAFLIVATGVIGSMLVAARLLRVREKTPSKLKHDTYECGESPTGMAWVRFHARYYVVALFFVLFDSRRRSSFPGPRW